MNSNKPNVLFVFSDQHRKFDIGCYGHEFVKTPNLDRLAGEGLLFEHCISNSPVCVPARGSLLTGQFAGKHKAFTNDIAIDCSILSVADVLRQGGYHTGYIGKWHLAGIPRDQAVKKERRLGFEHWKVCNCNHDYLNTYYYDENNLRHDVEGYEPEIFTDLAVDFIAKNSASDTPWALYLSLATPHDPFDRIKSEFRDIYKDVEIKLRDNIGDRVRIKEGLYIDIEDYKEQTKGYFGHISAIDKQIGKLLAQLEKVGQLDNTIIFYTTDHGDMLGSQGEKDKQLPHEESVAVPLIAYHKDNIRHGVCDELIGLVDLPVTIASLVGLDFSAPTDGKDLKNLFVDSTATSYDSAYIYDYFPCHQAEGKNMKAWRGIRTKRYTYAVQSDNLNWVLYDNLTDPLQQNNLAGKEEHKELQDMLWQMLSEHIAKHDKLLSGLDYVVYSRQVEEFNASQNHFKRKLIANEV